MANATIGPVTGVQTGMFTVNISFDASIRGLDETDVNLRSLTENGATGVSFEVTGTEPSANFNLPFTLPANAEGSFEISITGMVTPDGGSTPEAVMANTVVVFYDTTANVAATFGTIEYRDDGVIAVPVNFAENVVVPSKTVFRGESVDNSDLSGMTYIILGEDDEWELVFTVPPDRKGSFRITPSGDVLKVSSGVWDNIVGTPITVDYNTAVPQIVDFDVPADYTPGKNFDTRLAYNALVTGLHLNNVHEVFLLEGAAEFMTPTPYKWTGAEPTDLRAFLQTAVPDDLTGTDWQELAAPPPGIPSTEDNDFDADGQWHGEEGQYFLIRWLVDPGATGIFSMTPRDGMLRGPVS